MQPTDFVTLWNTACQGTKMVRAFKMTATDARTAKGAIEDEGDPAVWAEAFHQIASRPFCSGQNDRGWKASLTYALRPHHRGETLDKAREALLSRQEHHEESRACACGKPAQNGSRLCYECLLERARTA
jgi:hypothetical protein